MADRIFINPEVAVNKELMPVGESADIVGGHACRRSLMGGLWPIGAHQDRVWNL